MVFDFIEFKSPYCHIIIIGRFYRSHLGILYKMEALGFPVNSQGDYTYIYIYTLMVCDGLWMDKSLVSRFGPGLTEQLRFDHCLLLSTASQISSRLKRKKDMMLANMLLGQWVDWSDYLWIIQESYWTWTAAHWSFTLRKFIGHLFLRQLLAVKAKTCKFVPT